METKNFDAIEIQTFDETGEPIPDMKRDANEEL